MKSLPISYILFVVLCTLFSTGQAQAQWGIQDDSTVNRLVCDSARPAYPAACPDGKNGAIIVWQDSRGGGSTGIYAQHLDSNGRELWQHNGVSLCKNSTFNGQFPVVATDGNGGAYVAWQDSRYAGSGRFGVCVFGQHIKSNGTLAYPDTALPLVIGKNDRRSLVICDDGIGGAYLACEDYRNGIASSEPDIYMNRMRTNGVKFGIDTSNTGAVTSTYQWVFVNGNWVNTRVPVFHDPNAHFRSELSGDFIWLVISGRFTQFRINSVTDDTTLSFVTYPADGENITYYIEGPVGLPVDTVRSKQTHPAICNDGLGGCFIAWQSTATVPTSIYATRVDSNGIQLWNPAPGPGALVFKSNAHGSPIQPDASHVSIRRDGQQLLLAWEVRSTNSVDTQDVWATRIRCSTITDTTQMWGGATDLLSNMLYNQTYPQIFSDDSAIVGNGNPKGVLLVFENQKPGMADDWDVSMIRVLGDGTTQKPGNFGAYDFESQPHGQTGFQAVKIDQDTSILAVWNDSRYKDIDADTCIFAQAIDKYGRKRFPTMGSKDKRGKPICHGPDGSWNARQVGIVPRTNGAIVFWQDFRRGQSTPTIYAQLIFKDGSLPVELMSFDATSRYRGQVDLTWKTASEQENAGFEVERASVGQDSGDLRFSRVASYTSENALRGAGSSNIQRHYAWTDRGVEPSIYEYRLVEVALDGTRITHDSKRVDARYGATIESWAVGPNQPNPFANTTILPISVPLDAMVDVTLYDVTGREVAQPVVHQHFSRGVHEISIDRTSVGAATSLLARVTAYDIETGGILWQSEKPVMMSVVR